MFPRFDGIAARLASKTFVVCTLCLLVTGGSTALAANSEDSRPPLKMTFVDATPDQSAAIYDKLQTIIEQSDNIAYTDSSDFLYESEKFDVTLETLRETGSRTENREVIRRAMRGQGLESIVVYKREPDTLHLVVIGPRGRELRHFRSDVEQPQISDDQAVRVLEKIFEVLMPEVEDFRDEQSSGGETSDETSTADADGDGGESSSNDPESIRQAAIREHRREYGNLQPNLTLTLEPTVGRRQLSLTDQSDFQLQHVTPLLGGGFHADSILSVVSGARAAIGATLHGSFAPFKTNFGPIDQPVSGRYLHGGVGFRYLGGLSRHFILFGEAGGRFLQVALDNNEFYSGSLYVTGVGGMGLIYRISDAVQARLFAGALPTFLNQTHNGAFGPSTFSLGAEGTARFNFTVSDPFVVSAFYRFQFLSPSHPNPPDHAGTVAGTDMLHTGGIGFGVDL